MIVDGVINVASKGGTVGYESETSSAAGGGILSSGAATRCIGIDIGVGRQVVVELRGESVPVILRPPDVLALRNRRDRHHASRHGKASTQGDEARASCMRTDKELYYCMLCLLNSREIRGRRIGVLTQ